jgi:hypothetical protein
VTGGCFRCVVSGVNGADRRGGGVGRVVLRGGGARAPGGGGICVSAVLDHAALDPGSAPELRAAAIRSWSLTGFPGGMHIKEVRR